MVPIGGDGNSRGGSIFIFRYRAGNNFGTTTYYTTSGYCISASANVNFDSGNVGLKCTCNTWGLDSVPCNVIANGVWYKTL